MQTSIHLDKTRLAVAAGIIAVCCIHFGIGEFFSIQFVGFVVLVVLTITDGLRRLPVVLALATAMLLVVSLSGYFGGHESQLVLKGLRTGFAMILLYLLQWRVKRGSTNWQRLGIQVVFWSCSAAATLASLQLVDSVTINSGAFDIPVDWFALDYGTLFEGKRAQLAANGYFVRPTGFFSEPSALAALGLLGLVVGYRTANLRLKAISLYVNLVSLSLIGILFSILVVVAGEVRGRYRMQSVVYAFLGVAVVVAVALSSEVVSERLSSAIAGGDISTRIRLVEPLLVISRIAMDGQYFGVGEAAARSWMASEVSTVFSNWILNQFIFYGLLGSVFIALPFFLLRRGLWTLMFIYMVTNGDAFYYDRVLLMGFAIMAIYGSKKVKERA